MKYTVVGPLTTYEVVERDESGRLIQTWKFTSARGAMLFKKEMENQE